MSSAVQRPDSSRPRKNKRGRLAAARQLVQSIVDSWKQGEVPSADGALAKHPQLGDFHSLVLELAYEEYCIRVERGETLDAASYCRRFPQCEYSLWRQLAIDELLDFPPDLHAEINWPAVGDLFHGYTIIEELGRGTFSRVFLASEKLLGGRLVAIKICRQGADEAETLGKLQHPHIVQILSVRPLADDELTVICMPYVGRATLEHVLAGRRKGGLRTSRQLCEMLRHLEGPRPLESGAEAFRLQGSYLDGVLWIAASLASALAYAHRRGVVHLDLKPSNVLLSGDGTPRLLDFNLCFDAQRWQPRLGGTLPYMSPEQIDAVYLGGRPTLDGNSDVFSLAVIVGELLTGSSPFGDTSRPAGRTEADSPSAGQSSRPSSVAAKSSAAKSVAAKSVVCDSEEALSEEPVPAGEGAVPASEGAVPASEGAVPASEGAVPSSEGAVPASECTVPASECAVPASEGAVPAGECAVPASECTVPAGECTVPAGEGESIPSELKSASGNAESRPGESEDGLTALGRAERLQQLHAAGPRNMTAQSLGVSPACARILRRCLSTDPLDRPSAEEVERVLRREASGVGRWRRWCWGYRYGVLVCLLLTMLVLSPVLLHLANRPPYAERQRMRATALLAEGQHGQAIERLNGVIESDPRDFDALFLRGRIYAAQKDYPSAIRDLKLVVDGTRDAQAMAWLGYACSLFGAHRDACHWYRQCISMGHESPEVFSNLAYSEFRRGNPFGAKQFIESAIERDQHLRSARHVRAIIDHQLSLDAEILPEKAISDIEWLLLVEGTNLQLLIDAARVYSFSAYLDDRWTTEAVRAIERAAESGAGIEQLGHDTYVRRLLSKHPNLTKESRPHTFFAEDYTELLVAPILDTSRNLCNN